MTNLKRDRVAFYIENFSGAGVQVVTVRLANEFVRRGYAVDLCVCDPRGPLAEDLHPNVTVVRLEPKSLTYSRWLLLKTDPGGVHAWLLPYLLSLDVSKTLVFFPALADYLRDVRPDILFTATVPMNIEAYVAARMARFDGRHIVSEHNDLSRNHPLSNSRMGRWLIPLCRRCYRDAHGIVAVSEGVAADMVRRTGIGAERITMIYCPAVRSDIESLAEAPVEHPWFTDQAADIILGVGRPGRTKDFGTLIRAFALVRKERPVKLVILGRSKSWPEVDKRQQGLLKLATELGVTDDFSLPGFFANPYAFMARASVLAVSSINEGFCMVLAEAMACGCPVVSTDCPSGPAEILDHGKFGPLVPIGDPQALAAAIKSVLDKPLDAQSLKARAQKFSVEKAADEHEQLFFGRSLAVSKAAH